MYKCLILRKSRIWTFWTALIIVFLFLFLGQTVNAEENPDEIAKKHGITFPVAELGNCSNYSACRTYCEDPVNGGICLNFAKKKGFYKQNEQDSRKEELLKKAKTELGCDSYNSCQDFCRKAENFDKCSTFAQKNNLGGGRVENPEEKRILEKAREILGCDNPSSCMSFCEKEENRTKCSEFARQAGLRGGEQRIGPGGCNSEETCKAFCSSPANYQVCSGFSRGTGKQFSGPGGCSSEESCRTYCKDHPEDCGYGDDDRRFSPPPGYNPQEMCSRTPSCRWDDNTCKCGFYDNPEEAKRRAEEHARFCRENPGKCGIGKQGDFQNKDEKEKFEKYCRENPDRCGSKNSYIEYNPENSCKNAGCRWDDNGCNCSGVTSGPMIECTKKQGCSWINSSCQCSNAGPTNYYPGPSGYNSGTSNTYNTCSLGQYWNGQNCIPNSYSGNSPTTGDSTSRDQQEAACRAGGGTCDWSSGICSCKSSSSGTSGGSGSSMSREQQESGCRSCGGTCNWNGDMCNCQCGSSGSTSTQTQSTPQPTQESQTQQTQTQTPQPEQQSSPSVQGVNTGKSLLQIIWENISALF